MTMNDATVDPRVRRSRARITAAAIDELRATGYGDLTMEGVAARAGVGKATIYRHWSSKATLVLDAAQQMREHVAVPTTGTARQRLAAVYRTLISSLIEPGLSDCLPAILDAAGRDPELADLYREFLHGRRAPARAVLMAGIDSGEIAADIDVDAVIDLIAGPVFYRRYIARRPQHPDDAVDLVNRVLDDPPRRR